MRAAAVFFSVAIGVFLCAEPADPPDFPAEVTRTLDPEVWHSPPGLIDVTLEVKDATNEIRIVETVPWALEIVDSGEGTVEEDPITQTRTISFEMAGNASTSYLLVAFACD